MNVGTQFMEFLNRLTLITKTRANIRIIKYFRDVLIYT